MKLLPTARSHVQPSQSSSRVKVLEQGWTYLLLLVSKGIHGRLLSVHSVRAMKGDTLSRSLSMLGVPQARPLHRNVVATPRNWAPLHRRGRGIDASIAHPRAPGLGRWRRLLGTCGSRQGTPGAHHQPAVSRRHRQEAATQRAQSAGRYARADSIPNSSESGRKDLRRGAPAFHRPRVEVADVLGSQRSA